MLISLDPDEIELAYVIGSSRHKICEDKNYKDYKKSTIHKSSDLDIIGVLGEIAVAKAFNCLEEYVEDCINNVGWTLKDVGKVQVRTTPLHTGRLIIRPGDGRGKDGEKLEEPFILVIQLNNKEYKLAGWIIGKNGIQDKWKFNPYGKGIAYFIPQNELNPMDKLDASYFKT